MVINENEEVVGKYRKKLVVGHYNIIESSFWKAHPTILGESADPMKHYRSRIPITSQTFRFYCNFVTYNFKCCKSSLVQSSNT